MIPESPVQDISPVTASSPSAALPAIFLPREKLRTYQKVRNVLWLRHSDWPIVVQVVRAGVCVYQSQLIIKLVSARFDSPRGCGFSPWIYGCDANFKFVVGFVVVVVAFTLLSLSLCLSVWLTACLSVYLYVCLSVCLNNYLSVCISPWCDLCGWLGITNQIVFIIISSSSSAGSAAA